MQHNKLNQIASRQLDYSVRDFAFGALMAVVIAVMLLAFISRGSVAPAAASAPEPAAYTLADMAADLEAHTHETCGDLEAVQPANEPTC